tara:strand:- start:90 stop:608 length:519 start_codon:yes stop_codon:yes gene_type:complete
MKKLILCAAIAAFGLSNVNAQDSDKGGNALSEGSWVIEANTGSWAVGNTAFSLTSVDGFTAYSVGAEAGYFVMDNLAIKAGLGYNGADDIDGSFVYKVGAKYYIAGEFPVGVDFTGASVSGENANWVGLQGGYAWFVADNISIEPTLRYNMTLDDMKAESAFQGLIGFALHF